DVRSGRRGARSVWWPAALVALWANLHGGFVTGVALIGAAAVATAAETLPRGDGPARRVAMVLGLATVATALAVLANPSGIELPLAIGRHLGMQSTAYFEEFQSPSFLTGGVAVRTFEIVLLGLLALTAAGRACFPLADVAMLLVTAHWALIFQRNMNVFVL